MNMNSYMPVKLFTGKGCVLAHAEEFGKLGSKPLIVTGRTSAKASGALNDVMEAVASGNANQSAASDEGPEPYILFDEIGQNPALTDCMRAAELAIRENCDYVIGIGGGSPLDAAKCIAVLAANPGMTQAELYSLKWPVKPLPIVVVGTTAGTGSEVTKVSVITIPDGRKKSFHHEDVFPKVAFGDPSYTMTLSKEFTASTAIDALAHATESYFSRNANEISQCYAVQAIRMLKPLLGNLEKLTFEDRENLYNASIYGGLAINITGTCLPHAMGYLMTEQHGIPHGNACAIFLPAFLEINEREVPRMVQRFFASIGWGRTSFLQAINYLLADVHVEISEEEIAREHSRWIGNGSIAKGWGQISADECDEILRRVRD